MDPLRRGPGLGLSLALWGGSLAGGVALGANADLLRPAQAEARDRAPRRVDARQWLASTATPVGRDLLLVGSAPSRAHVTPPRPDPFAGHMAGGRVITGATPHRLILFTFDDGPDLRNTPRLLDMLDNHGIRAVFFLTAERIRPDTPWGREHAALAREIAARGHLIGNHTVDHAQLPLLSDAEVQVQLDTSQRIFEDVFGERPWLFRHPGGARSPRVDALIAQRGYTSMLWNLGTGDFQVRTPEDVLSTWERVFERRALEQGDAGGIVLMHDIHEWSVDAVPLILAELDRRNCELLEQGEELYDIVDDPVLFFQPRGDAPPHTEAAPAKPDPALLRARQARLRRQVERRCGALAVR